MSKICYVEKKFNAEHRLVIELAEKIIVNYQRQGFVLTLRQLYYQFVARGYTSTWKSGQNTVQSYKRLGSIIHDAKKAGLLAWEALEDRMRTLESESSWPSAAAMIDTCAEQFHINRWKTQRYAPEVWIEKDALAGVIEGVCKELDVPYFACRGYVSGSAMWRAGVRAYQARRAGKTPIIFHLGDHDPSGLDMTRDNREQLELYSQGPIKVERLALNMKQVQQFNPPPNPAKESDSRHAGYQQEFGDESWELDALEPVYISNLIRSAVTKLIDLDEWRRVEEREQDGRRALADSATRLRDEGHGEEEE